MRYHFKLLSDHPKLGKAGETKAVETEAERKQLIDLGFAEACEDPNADAVAAAVEGVVKSIGDSVGKAVDTAMAGVLQKTQDGISKLKLPATAKDHDEEKMHGFKSAGEFWRAVVLAENKNGPIDSRLVGKAPSGVNTLDASEGGYLVPETISNTIMETVWDTAGIPARCDRYEVPGGSLKINANDETSRATGSRRGGVRGYWLSEAAQYTASKPAWRQITLDPHKLGVFIYVTEEQLQDTTGFALESKLAQYAAEEIDWLLTDAILNGDGVGKPLGILNAPGTLTISAEGGQTADTINFANVRKMYFRMLPRSRSRAVWLVNVDCLPTLMQMSFPDASGTSPLMIQGLQFPTIAGAPVTTLMGLPVIPIEQAKTVGDLGDITLADLGMYALGTKGGVRSSMSMHLRFDYDETAFKFSFRADGEPVLASVITPANGSNTLSPFINLAAR